MAEVRTFLAVPLDPALRDPVLRLVRRLHPLQPGGAKWAESESLHFTLAFLGGVPEERLEAVFAAARQAASGTPPFRLQLGALGMFPDHGTRRVLWIGADRGAAELTALQAKLAAALTRAGFALEARAFVPHLTLARARTNGHLDPRLASAGTDEVRAASQMVPALDVFRSDLTHTGPHYTCLEHCLLEKNIPESAL
jgi:RNA 2',3'-cyclic 3'-phosphodiesterase